MLNRYITYLLPDHANTMCCVNAVLCRHICQTLQNPDNNFTRGTKGLCKVRGKGSQAKEISGWSVWEMGRKKKKRRTEKQNKETTQRQQTKREQRDSSTANSSCPLWRQRSCFLSLLPSHLSPSLHTPTDSWQRLVEALLTCERESSDQTTDSYEKPAV